MTEKVEITYPELRAIVVALFNAGVLNKQQGLTFSHGNIGNEYLALAARIDKFVADLEPRHVLTLLNNEELEKHTKERRNHYETLRCWHEFAHELGEILGFQTVTDEYLKEVKKLKGEVLRLEGLIATRGLKRNRRKGARFSDLERSVEKVNANPSRDRTSRKRVKDRRS
jgi:hypothetical protein